MSRARELLRRLDHVNQLEVSEQTPHNPMPSDDDEYALQHRGGTERMKRDQNNDGSEDNSTENSGESDDENDEQNIDPRMTNPDSPFSRVTHNPDGSLKVDPDDHHMNDRGRFIVRRKR